MATAFATTALADPYQRQLHFLTMAEQELSLTHRLHLFLVENLHQGLTLKDLSCVIGYSEKYCSEWFAVHMGESFSGYIKRLRLERAALLLDSPRRLVDIAQRLGFQDQYAFSHFFKKATGVSPQIFRERGDRPLPHVRPFLRRPGLRRVPR